ncbi:flagellar filament capping protein FliD [Cohnella sp. CFH 77786]|uniref:flagellar filament capping protein FliD n=1 Tax=Cohnella sp. CFH 77786 TaxID=2662265 RepID=UPI001C611198|nr:flagellar filament capping protein FliD [Cohnella sp. CFH 77786]
MMLSAGSSVRKIFAASYVHNQLYYQPSNRYDSGGPRSYLSSEPVSQYYRAAASGIVSILKAAKELKSASLNVLKPDTSAFNSRTAVSSDQASVLAKASAGAAFESYRVRVDQAAASQVNSGSFLAKSALTSVRSGTNAFTITSGGITTSVSAFIYGNDTNEQALTKLRDAVNEAKSGVTASIVTDAKTGGKKLELASSQTGAKNAFSIADVTGNAVAATGIGNVKTMAADAIYSVDGGTAVTSSSNVIDLEEGKATATLLKPTSDDAEIQVKPDEAGVLKQVKQLISDYNETLGRVREAGSYLNDSVKRSLENAANGYGSVGIAKQADGTLKLDETKFKASLSAQFENTRRAVSGPDGLAVNLSKAADRLENMPPHAMLNPRVRAMQSYAAYQSSAGLYFQLPTRGLLFDGTF